MSNSDLKASHALTHLNLIAILWGRCYYHHHYVEEKPEGNETQGHTVWDRIPTCVVGSEMQTINSSITTLSPLEDP